MARKSARAALVISAEERQRLEQLRDSRKAPKRQSARAAILLRYVEGEGPTAIQAALGVSRPTIYKCIDKALAAGAQAGLKDRYHRPKEPLISEQAKAWVLNHGSSLNLIKTVFGKMARTFLKGIRVTSREELKQRILQGAHEMNLAPVVVRWKKHDLGLA